MTRTSLTWLCWLCGGQFRGESDTAHQGAWGRLCWGCWMLGAESEGEEREDTRLEHNTVT